MEHSLLADDPVSVLSQHGKTFRWASHLLSDGSLQRAARLYRFLRWLDDLADEASHVAGEGPTLLYAIRRALQPGADDQALPAAVRDELRFLLEELRIEPGVLEALLSGLLQDLGTVAMASGDQLLRYCYRVAGTVGLMMCAVFGVRQPAAAAFAIDLGIAMQLTNICRDVRDDALRGRLYLPLGRDLGQLSADDSSADFAVRTMLASTLELAEQYYASGLAGLGYLPWQARWTIACAAVLYRAIGRKLRRQGLPWQQGRVYLGSGEKMLTILQQLPTLLRLVLRAPVVAHDRSLHAHLAGLPHVAC